MPRAGRKSDPIIRHATQAAQKLEQLGDPRAANDVRKACQHSRYLLGLIDNLRSQLNSGIPANSHREKEIA